MILRAAAPTPGGSRPGVASEVPVSTFFFAVSRNLVCAPQTNLRRCAALWVVRFIFLLSGNSEDTIVRCRKIVAGDQVNAMSRTQVLEAGMFMVLLPLHLLHQRHGTWLRLGIGRPPFQPCAHGLRQRLAG